MKQKILVGEVMITEEQIRSRVKELADEINKDYPEGELILVGILKGCFVFISDLARLLKSDVRIHFMRVSSYGSATMSSGCINIKEDLDVDICGKNVLIAEDIVDSGNTLSHLVKLLESRNPKSLKVCSLLSKPSRREVEFEADYTGFEIPDEFIVGYGLDCDEKFRQLPYIAAVKLS